MRAQLKQRDDTHMTSMKIVQFSRSFNPLDLGRPILSEPPPPPPNDNQSIKRKHNPGMNIICYQVLPLVGFRFQYQTLILSDFPSTSFHLGEASLSAISWLYTIVSTVVNCVQLFNGA